jgi:UDP-N-acetylglucosamine--N-acetylmuramyl-(pentapeptide) pyrophosphoryl-undecaprenol N-acetylglucosamine transferase
MPGPDDLHPPSIVIAAGGTGGHIYPGLALAEAIHRAAPDSRVSFVGTPHGMESEIITAAGHQLDLYDMVQFNDQGWRKLLVPAALARGTVQARAVLGRRRADVAVTMGGYAGVPLVLGARLRGVPSVVYEPSAVPGQANRFAARFTPHVATSLAATRFPGRTPRHVGPLVQSAFATFDRDALRDEARAALGVPDGTTLVLVTGGSLGSRRLNQLALGLAERWEGRDDVRLLVKTGARTHEETTVALAATPGRELVDLRRYLDRIDHAYAAADLAIARAGAATVAELALVGLPAILVPLPLHEHDEQRHNAAPVVAAGGAVLVDDDAATADHVGPLIEPLLADPAALSAMARAASGAVPRDAADRLASWVLQLASGRSRVGGRAA